MVTITKDVARDFAGKLFGELLVGNEDSELNRIDEITQIISQADPQLFRCLEAGLHSIQVACELTLKDKPEAQKLTMNRLLAFIRGALWMYGVLSEQERRNA